MNNLVRGCWEFQGGPWMHAAIILAGTIVLRGIMCGLRAMPLAYRLSGFWPVLKNLFCGFHPRDQADYWLPTILGTIELYAYPLLLVEGEWTVAGAWIGLKAVTHHLWKVNRTPFNRFLIGNALVVLVSLWFLVPRIKPLACV